MSKQIVLINIKALENKIIRLSNEINQHKSSIKLIKQLLKIKYKRLKQYD